MTAVVQMCVAGERCRNYNRASKKPGWVDGLPLCAGCITHAERLLDPYPNLDAHEPWALVADYIGLEQILPPGSGDSEYITGSKELPMPLRGSVEALQAEIRHVLTTWERIVRVQWALSAPVESGVRGGYAVQQAARILHPRVRGVADLPAQQVQPAGLEDAWASMTGAEALLALDSLHYRARAHLGLTRRTERLYGRCRFCGLSTLETIAGTIRTALSRESGSEVVRCGSCGAGYTWTEYEQDSLVLGRAIADGHAEVAELLDDPDGQCGCACHGTGTAYAVCSVAGGCGSEGCDGHGHIVRRSGGRDTASPSSAPRHGVGASLDARRYAGSRSSLPRAWS